MSVRKNIGNVTSNVPGEAGKPREYGISTVAVHAGARPDPVTGAHEVLFDYNGIYIKQRDNFNGYSTWIARSGSIAEGVTMLSE